jgi:hypothetical protein
MHRTEFPCAWQAQKHVLVLARSRGLDCLSDVQEEHLSVLKRMHAVGLKWAEKFLSENASLVFRLGYHSVCRVYTQDVFSFFTSPAQKKKRK